MCVCVCESVCVYVYVCINCIYNIYIDKFVFISIYIYSNVI